MGQRRRHGGSLSVPRNTLPVAARSGFNEGVLNKCPAVRHAGDGRSAVRSEGWKVFRCSIPHFVKTASGEDRTGG
jgi:hypothetical protein